MQRAEEEVGVEIIQVVRIIRSDVSCGEERGGGPRLACRVARVAPRFWWGTPARLPARLRHTDSQPRRQNSLNQPPDNHFALHFTIDPPSSTQTTIMAESTPVDPIAEVAEDAASLKSLITAANLQYGLKNYSRAAELYSQATELQAEENGEMALENAELLYLYGRCLYHVAVAKSDVLGGRVAGEDTSKKQKKSKAEDVAEPSGAESTDSATAAGAEKAIEAEVDEKTEKANSKPFFQFVEQESDEEEGDEEGEDDGEEEDDFANAYEILDIARVLLEKQVDAVGSGEMAVDAAISTDVEEGKGKGKAAASNEPPEAVRQIKARLADTHDLQAEISLENERFADAVEDQRKALQLKKDLHANESSLIAEAHFKLSLALEFASMDQVRLAQADDASEELKKNAQVDMKLREEAAVEMESAIDSCRSRVKKEESELSELPEDQREDKLKSIKDVKEMIEEMEQRVSCTCISIRSAGSSYEDDY
jgi:HAT1-interacting factor 1